MDSPDYIFEEIKRVASAKDSKRKGILWSTLFSTFYMHEVPSWRGAARSVAGRLLKLNYRRYAVDGPNDKKFVLVANTNEAHHYQQIVDSLQSLLHQNSVAHGVLSIRDGRASVGKHVATVLQFFFFLVWLIGNVNYRQVEDWDYFLRKVPLLFANYREVRLNRERFSEHADRISCILVINEDWLPESGALSCAEKYGIKTIHYPHGMIGDVNLPLRSQVQLFWNDEMRRHFRFDGFTGYSIGFLEQYRSHQNDTEVPPDFDVVLTSQVHAEDRNPAGKDFINLFEHWGAVAKEQSLKIAVKLHPFDSKGDREKIERALEGDLYFEVFSGDIPLTDLLHQSEIHSTVSSGSILVSARLGVPTLVYKGGEHLRRNGAEEVVDVFSSRLELKDALNHIHDPVEVPSWLQDEAIEQAFGYFVNHEVRMA